eukprot:Nk52_evm1s1865 gene=Nk52_evmTU1s1865
MSGTNINQQLPPSIAAEAVLVKSASMPEGSETVSGYDFNQGMDYNRLLESFATTGYQASNFGRAVEEVRGMLAWRPSEAELDEWVSGEQDESTRAEQREKLKEETRTKIFLGYTSNLISSGVREVIRFLVEHHMVDVVVSTAGGVEEDFIKCMGKTYLGEFNLRGAELRKKGINRIGNLLVPNDNYCKFEDWLMPILDAMLVEQERDGVKWTPSRMIHRLGKEINHPESVYYWAYKNNIPVYCPAITDGSLGDIIYFHSFRNPGLVIDLVEDIRGMNNQAVFARHTGMVILGGGLVKHHICNANLMRNGADHAVFINTGQEFDGSDAGARPDEAVSWGKIKMSAAPVKVYGEATLLFPLLVAQTFAKQHWEGERKM